MAEQPPSKGVDPPLQGVQCSDIGILRVRVLPVGRLHHHLPGMAAVQRAASSALLQYKSYIPEHMGICPQFHLDLVLQVSNGHDYLITLPARARALSTATRDYHVMRCYRNNRPFKH